MARDSRVLSLRGPQLTEPEGSVEVELASLPAAPKLLRAYFCAVLDRRYFADHGTPARRPAATRRYPELDGGQTARGRRCQPVWPRLVEACDERNLNAFEYVDFFLSKWPTKGAQAPTAMELLDWRRISECSRQLNGLRFLPMQLRLQQQHYALRYAQALRQQADGAAASRHRAAQLTALSDVRPPATALFRYSMGMREGFPAQVQGLFPAAALQYVLRRNVYDQVWGALLPATLRQVPTVQLLNVMEYVTSDVREQQFDDAFRVTASGC